MVRRLARVCIVILRQGLHSALGIISITEDSERATTDFPIDKEDLKWVDNVPLESIVDLYGIVEVGRGRSCLFEIAVHRLIIVSAASESARRIFSLQTARSFEYEVHKSRIEPFIHERQRLERELYVARVSSLPAVALQTALDAHNSDLNRMHFYTANLNDAPSGSHSHRLRSPGRHAIVKLRSRLLQFCHAFFGGKDYIEMHTPRLLNSRPVSGWESFVVHPGWVEENERDGRSLFLHPDAFEAHRLVLSADFGSVYEVCQGHYIFPPTRDQLELTKVEFSSVSFHSWEYYLQFVSAFLVEAISSIASDSVELDVFWRGSREAAEKGRFTCSHRDSASFGRGEMIPILTDLQGDELLRAMHGDNIAFESEHWKLQRLAHIVKQDEGSDAFIRDHGTETAWLLPDSGLASAARSATIFFRGVPAVACSKHSAWKLEDGMQVPEFFRSILFIEHFMRGVLGLGRAAEAALVPRNEWNLD